MPSTSAPPPQLMSCFQHLKYPRYLTDALVKPSGRITKKNNDQQQNLLTYLLLEINLPTATKAMHRADCQESVGQLHVAVNLWRMMSAKAPLLIAPYSFVTVIIPTKVVKGMMHTCTNQAAIWWIDTLRQIRPICAFESLSIWVCNCREEPS